jgi:SNF2 family DNA or RNA helicase/HJR/Mrr/RecB family endonuclease
VSRDGCIINLEDIIYLLTENQFKICEAIDEFNNLRESDKGNLINFKKLSELKSLSKESGLTLEFFLNNQDLFIPEKIKLDIDFNDGLLEIIPTVEINNPRGFTNTFNISPNVQDVYSINGNNGNTTRVIISGEQKIELKKIKDNGKISDNKIIQEIIEHPEIYFNDKEIDFAVFYSDRVKEIGIYSPKFYPFTSPYKSKWIPGILIKDKVDGDKKIFFKTIEDLKAFKVQKERAEKDKKNFVQWEGADIPLVDADKIIKTADKQFKNPNKPIEKIPNSDQLVLIIKENAELTEFDNLNGLPENFIHNFYEIRNLNDEIKLMDHQTEGVSWLQSLYKEKFSGCLLADDMGLGKTLQLLYFIEWHNQYNNENKPYLIVAPVSLLENWEKEYQKFFNPTNLQINLLYGSVGLTKENNHLKNQIDAKALQKKQIILTSYETVRNYQISLGLVDFAVIVLDEAQKIKTPGTLITNASKALKGDFKIAMTGTPVENTLVDLWCLMDFAVPGLLGNAKDFAKEYHKPLSDESTDIKALTEKLRNNIGVFIKRRLKIDVAKDLPIKHDNPTSRFAKVMPIIQLNIYKQEIELANNTDLTGVAMRNQKLKSLSALKLISDHPYLLESQIMNFTIEELISSSSKLETTIEILEKIKYKDEKVIIFAERRDTQQMLQKVINNIFGVFPSIINGDTPTTKQAEGKSKISRQQTIDRFQSVDGFNVIIMSPIAAGVGLNVTEANHIIHYSRHWNPAKEQQATDRAYRIGQKKEVFVYYPMAIFPKEMVDENGKKIKSFDEVLDLLLQNKANLASNTLFPTDQAEITPDDLFGTIFSVKTESNRRPLSMLDIDRLNPNLFEASIAALYKIKGFDIFLTPYSNDKGVDVVVMKNDENYLIQVKQSKSILGNDAVQEVCAAKKYYEIKFNQSFKLLVITNNEFSPNAQLLANANNIQLYNRKYLEQLLTENEITFLEINNIESQRMDSI